MNYLLMNKEGQLGKCLELFISKKNLSSRVNKQQITLDENGVLEDKFYAKDPSRSVLITSLESYDIAKNKNISLEYGILGENILIDYNPYSLNVGTKIKIGKVVLEISQNCTLCKSLTKVDNRLPKLLKEDRGIFAKVIKAGIIYQNDNIYLYTK